MCTQTHTRARRHTHTHTNLPAQNPQTETMQKKKEERDLFWVEQWSTIFILRGERLSQVWRFDKYTGIRWRPGLC